MAQSPRKPKRLSAVVDALRTHGMKDEELASIQARIDPLFEEGEIHIHIEGDDTHFHIDVHELE